MRIRVILMLFVLALVLPVLAQDGPPPMPELDGDIVMAGLNGPLGVYVDSVGHVWIIDSGAGGDEHGVEHEDRAGEEEDGAPVGRARGGNGAAPGRAARGGPR